MIKRRIMALALAACMLALNVPALATGLIGSVSGVKEGDDIQAYNQGDLTEDASDDAPDEGLTPDAAQQPEQGAALPTPAPVGTMSEAEQALYQRLSGESPIQEGWQIEFAGDSVLVMLAAPDLIVWRIAPESGIMELLWSRDLHEFLPDSEGNPSIAVSPDGTRALIAPSDGSVYMIDATSQQQIAPEGTAPGRFIWARDSQSYAYQTENGIHAFTPSFGELMIAGDVIMPISDEMDWLNPGATPEALAELLESDKWTYAGTGMNCVLFDSEDGAESCAYLMDTGSVVNYPETIYSSMTIGKSGACPIYDQSAKRYRLYTSDGSFADIPMLEVINESEMANPYGWLGDSVCVLEQDVSSRSSFRLHAANTATGITYTLLTPWEYADIISSQAKPE